MKAAIYARVSTANNGQDPTMQTRELREYCDRRGWIVTGEYVDIGISGTRRGARSLIACSGRRTVGGLTRWLFGDSTDSRDPSRISFALLRRSSPSGLNS